MSLIAGARPTAINLPAAITVGGSLFHEDVMVRMIGDITLPVDGGRTLEIAAAQNWSSLGEGEFEFEVRFRGLRPEPSPPRSRPPYQ